MLKRVIALVLMLVACGELRAQYTDGVTGLATIPTAEMQQDGRFMGGAVYLPKDMLPSSWGYSSFRLRYFLNVTLFPFLELSFVNTLRELPDIEGYAKFNQDRALAMKLRLTRERGWLPAIAIGSSDLISRLDNYNALAQSEANRYFASHYVVATKGFRFCEDNMIGVTLGYSFSMSNSSEEYFDDTLFYGVNVRPNFAPYLQFMADVRGTKVSIGAAALLWDHLSLNLFCYDFKSPSGGLRYETTLF
ncbi:MAG: YjbH domain-containing protein [Rikenellaceae bacterium]